MSFLRFLPWLAPLVVGALAGVAIDRTLRSDPDFPPAATGTGTASNPGASAAPARANGKTDAAVSFAAALEEKKAYRRRELVGELLPAMTVRQLIEAAESLRKKSNIKRWTDPAAAALVLGRLAQLDPGMALALASVGAAQGDVDMSVLSRVLDVLAETQPATAEAWIRSLPPGSARRNITGMWAALMAKIDPEAALRWIAADRPSTWSYRNIFEQMAETDPLGAVNRAASLPTGDQRQRALEGALSAWARTDPGSALSWIRNRPLDGTRSALLAQAMASYAESNPAAAASYALGALDGQERLKACEEVAQKWFKADFAAARAWLQGLPPEIVRACAPNVAAAWGEHDPAGAAAFAWEMEPDNRWNRGLRQVMSEWASRDFTAAKQWVAGLPPGAMRDTALSIMLDDRSWGGTNAPEPRVALDLAMTMGAGQTDLQRETINRNMQRWARDDFDAAAAWARGLPNQALGADLLKTALAEMAGYDPKRAILNIGLLPADARADATTRVASAWAFRDPAAAAQWVNSWPSGTDAAEVRRTITGTWLRTNPAAAVAWIQSLPNDVLAAAISPQTIRQLVSFDPNAALAVATRLPDGEARAQALDSFARSWYQRDPTSAGLWISQTGDLNAEQKQRAVQPRTGGGGRR